MSVVIGIESALQDEVRALVAALNEATLLLTPPAFCHHMTVEQMAAPHTTLFVAREMGRVIAMGALRRHAGETGEVKRMYTEASHRGRGVGNQILSHIEARARDEGLRKLVLETGSNFEVARRLYERAGFVECGPILDYAASPWNVFYEKTLLPNAMQ